MGINSAFKGLNGNLTEEHVGDTELEKYIPKIKLQRNIMWGCKMDSVGCASF
jgi:hypothetical protein